MTKIYGITFNGQKYWDTYIDPMDDWWEMEDEDFDVYKAYGISPTDLRDYKENMYWNDTFENRERLRDMYEDHYVDDCWDEELLREFPDTEPSEQYRIHDGKLPGTEADFISRITYFSEECCRFCTANEGLDLPTYHLLRIVDEQFGEEEIFVGDRLICWNILPDNFGSEAAGREIDRWYSCPEFEWS